MSDVFHKSCYTSRSSGYKYRTLSTNTGDKKRRDSHEDNTIDKKLKELRRAMFTRIDSEINRMGKARVFIQDRLNKVDAKIEMMIKFQQTVLDLREDIQQARSVLNNLVNKVDKIEMSETGTDNLTSGKISFRSQCPIMEEIEIYDINTADSIITHI